MMGDFTARSAVKHLVHSLLKAIKQDAPVEGLSLRAMALALTKAAGQLDGEADELIMDGILDAFDEQDTPEFVDAVWAVWDVTQLKKFERWLIERKLPATQPLRLVVLSLLKLDLLERIENRWKADSEAEFWIDPLLEFVSGPDREVGQRAKKVLLAIPEQAVDAREQICRWVIEHDHPDAKEIAISAGYEPRQPQLRALFYLFTEQWEAYEVLDFDRRLLAAVLDAADDRLRRMIAQAALKAGWSDFVDLAAGGRNRRRLGELDDMEWEVILAVLGRERRWQDLWKLAQSAPAHWSAKLIRSLSEQNWQPENLDESSAYLRLGTAARKALHAGEPVGRLTRYQAALAGHQRLVTSLAGIPDFHLLASASADLTVQLWDLAAGKPYRKLEGHTGFVLCLAVSPLKEDSLRLLASGGSDRTVRLWRLPDGDLQQTLGGHGGELAGLEFSPDGKYLISADARSINIWRIPGGELVRNIQGMFTGLISLSISPDGLVLVTLDSDKTLRLFSLPQGELMQTLLEPVVGYTMTAQGNLVTSSSYGTVRVWELSRDGTGSSLPGRTNTSRLLADPSGNWLACADRSNVRFWQLPDPESSQLLAGHNLLISALASSPDGMILASGADDQTIRLWQMPQGHPLPGAETLEGLNGSVKHLCYISSLEREFPDYLAASDDLTIHVWAMDDLDGFLRSLPGNITLSDLQFWEQRLTSLGTTSAEKLWLEFAVTLVHWQRRYDIDIQEGAPLVTVGAFDIEIEVQTP